MSESETNSTPEGVVVEPSENSYTDIVQFIDHAGEIVKETDNEKKSFLSTISKREDFLTKGFDYSVISILGPQSSGKSTLLNLLFNTRFAIMEARTGRKQTTQGVWMGIGGESTGPETFLILDVEGTDGRERGEDEKAFERKTSLFSLALSSVLIINMWSHDVGRYNAANLSLLKTVFELNLQLFQKKRNHKILIFFIIRDQDNVTPLSELRRVLLEDIEKIWKELSKPSEFANSRETDYFDFDFTALPHKNYSPDQFKTQVDILRQRFLDPSLNDFIPKKKYRNEDVPADGLYQYSFNVWETIKSNRDLDLPSQKEMLALYRCDEFLESSFNQFTSEIKSTRESIEKGRLVNNFGDSSKKILDDAIKRYDEPSSRYHPETVAKKRQVLNDRILTDLKYLFDKQIEKLYEKTIEFYNSLVQEAVKPVNGGKSSSSSLKRSGATNQNGGNIVIIPQFNIWAEGTKKKSIEYFEQTAKQSIVPGSDWTFVEELNVLDEKMTKEISQLRENQLEKLSSLMKENTFQKLNPILLKITDQASDNMWQKIRAAYNDEAATNEKEYQSRLTNDFAIGESECEEYLNKFKEGVLENLKSKISDRAEFIPMKMRKRFEEHFNMDDKKLPRKWKKQDDIATIFQEARLNAEKLIDLFSYLRIDEQDSKTSYFSLLPNGEHEENTNTNEIEQDKVIIAYKQCMTMCENFRHDTKNDYMQALSEQARLTSAGGIPGYVLVLLCVLGLNEFIAIITNPLLLLLVILLGGFGFVLFKLGLTGPFIDYSSQVLVHIINKIKDIVLHVENISHHAVSNNNSNSTNGNKEKRE
ncbi:hypothetical protein CYY_000280 [Polysphondylium violaceum]|uniref:Protein SEY1 homolog n=1 Tax=Polysphondylium violaceum TaxID=133409 RepID=A0A8J4Q1V3_9MYCE|nr:hypothetical protein CYY_000280 [Polysphondylium violaceum]